MSGKAKIGAILSLDGEAEFRKSVTSANNELSKMRSESALTKEQFAGQANTLKALEQKYDVLNRTLEVNKRKTEANKEGLDNARISCQKVNDNLKKLQEEYASSTKKMTEMESSSKSSTKEMEEQKKIVEELAENIKKQGDICERANGKVLKWETGWNNARAQEEKTNNELGKTKSLLDEASESTDKCASSIDKYGKQVKIAVDANINLQDVVKAIVLNKGIDAATDAVKSLADASVGTAIEITQAANQVQASTGTTTSAMQDYKNVMEDIYKNNYGDNFEDVADAISTIKQNMGNLDPTEMQEVAESAITLKDTFAFDYQEELRAVNMLTDTFGVSSKEAFNLIAQGAQNGLNKNGDLLDTINEYSVHYQQMGVSAEGFFNSLENGTASGTFSVDKLGDAYKEFGIRVKDTATSTDEAYQLLGLSADDMRTKFAAGGTSATNASSEVLTALFNMDDQVKQNQAGVDLFGTMWEDLGIAGIKSLTDVNGSMSETADAMESIKDIKYDDVTNRITTIGRVLQMKVAEPLVEKFLPAAEKGLGFVADNLDEVTTAAVGLGTAIAIYKFSKTDIYASIAKSIKSVTAATKAATLATEGETIATKGAAKATALWNTVLSAGPTGMLVMGIAAVTAAIIAYKLATKDATDAEDKLNDKLEEEKEIRNDAYETIVSGSKDYENNLNSIESEWGANQKLVDKLYELNDIQGKTTSQKAEMKAIVDQLSDDIPELSAAYDEETGKLSMNKSAMDDLLKSHKDYALYLASQNSLQDIAQQVTDSELLIEQVTEKIKDAKKAYNESMGDGFDYETIKKAVGANADLGDTANHIRDLEEELENYKNTNADATSQLEDAEENVQKYSGAIEDTTTSTKELTDATEESGTTTVDTTTEQADAYKALTTSIKESVKNAISLFEEFNGGAETTTEETIANLDSQIDGVSNWADNMKTLAHQAGSGMTDEFYDYLVELGPESATYIQELVDSLNSKDGDFQEICQKWMQAFDLEDQVAQETAAAEKTLSAAVDSMALTSQQRFDELVEQTKNASEGVGNAVGAGVAKGISISQSLAIAGIHSLSNDLITGMKNDLDIHSPSRKFKTEVGEQISKGVAFGITAKKGTAIASAKSLADDVYKSASSWLTKYKSTTAISLEDEKYFWKKVASTVKKGTTEYKEALKKAANIEGFEKKIKSKLSAAFNVSEYTENSKGEQVKKSVKDYYGDIYSAANTYFENYSITHKVSLQKEEYYWTEVQKKLKKGTQAYYDATKQLNSIKSEIKQAAADTKAQNKEYGLSGGALEQYKTYYKVSAKAEVDYWNIVRKQYKKGTTERIEEDQKYYDAKENLNTQLEELNNEYYENCKEVNEKLSDDIQDLTDTYNSAVSDRADTIYSSFNLLDEFSSTSSSGATLLYNLKTQVAGYADWEQQLTELGGKNVLSSDLLDELANMGPEASASIHALNSLSAEQLSEYEKLYEQKKELAESQAVKENEALRTETQTKIATLKATAQKELNAYKTEYVASVAELKTTIEAPLKTLAQNATKSGEEAIAKLIAGIKSGATKKSTKADLQKVTKTITKGLGTLPAAGKIVGTNMLQGILEGLTNKKQINKSAKDMVTALKKAIQEAADIHSPSRLFKKEIGVQLSAGVAEGITDESKSVNTAGTNMISDMLESAKKELSAQRASLQEYSNSLNTTAGITALNNLINIQPTQQTSVTVDNTGVAEMFGQMYGLMQQYLPQIGNAQIVMDSGAVVGETSAAMGTELAMMSKRLR